MGDRVRYLFYIQRNKLNSCYAIYRVAGGYADSFPRNGGLITYNVRAESHEEALLKEAKQDNAPYARHFYEVGHIYLVVRHNLDSASSKSSFPLNDAKVLQLQETVPVEPELKVVAI